MVIAIVSLLAFIVAILTFFSGFGLGTILTPVLLIFFPVELAIALTGVVHLFNNLFKLFLVGKNADKEVVFRFGVPAVLAAMVGSLILVNSRGIQPLFTYTIYGRAFEVYLVKFVISNLLIIFALIELIPFFKTLEFSKNKLPIGGLLCGFFGGLSGNQGALRSAFLIKSGLSKEKFIAITVIVSTFVDLTRLSVYSTRFLHSGLMDNFNLLFFTILGGIAGSIIGNKLLKKVTFKLLQIITAILLIIVSIALGAGLI